MTTGFPESGMVGLLALTVLALLAVLLAASPAAAQSLDATTHTYDGEVFEEDTLEYEISVEDVEGDDGPVAVFVGPDAEYVYEDSISGSNGDYSGTVDLSGRLPAGDVTVLYLHPNHPDGEMGDGEFEWGNTNFDPVAANVTSLGDLIDEMSGDLQDRGDVVEDLIEETVDATGSTDLLEKNTFTLSDQASVEINDIGTGDPDGVGTASPGAELVVRGTTNLDPNGRHIQVRASDGPPVADSSSYQDIPTEYNQSWSSNGVWEVDIELPDDLREGTYDVEASDQEEVNDHDTQSFEVTDSDVITGCGSTVRSPGVYEITEDLNTSGNCIMVDDAEDVVIDGGGHVLTGESPGIEDFGVLVLNSFNVTVRDLEITGWDDSAGVNFDTSDGGEVSDSVLRDNGVGVELEDSRNLRVSDSEFEGNERPLGIGSGTAEADRVTFSDSADGGVVVSFDSEYVQVLPAEDPEPNPDAEALGMYVEATSDDPAAQLDLSFHYDPDNLGDLDEESLEVWRYDGVSWSVVGGSDVDTSEHVVEFDTSEFSTFGVFGEESDDSQDDSDDGDSPDDGSDSTDDDEDSSDDSDDGSDDDSDDGSGDDGDGSTEDGNDGDSSDDGSGGGDGEGGSGQPRMPGFGVLAVLAALSVFALARFADRVER